MGDGDGSKFIECGMKGPCALDDIQLAQALKASPLTRLP